MAPEEGEKDGGAFFIKTAIVWFAEVRIYARPHHRLFW